MRCRRAVWLRWPQTEKRRGEGGEHCRLYFHPTPNPAKVALFLEEAGLPYEVIPVDTSKGEQHTPKFRAINPNGKVPAIVDTDGPGGKDTRVFDSTAILLYLAEKTGKFLGKAEDRPELLSWLLFIGSGLGPFSGQSVHFQFAAPEGLDYAKNGSGKNLVFQAARRRSAAGLSRPSNTAARTVATQCAPRGDQCMRCFLAMRALAISSTQPSAREVEIGSLER
jgi:glutathione S-transferase